MQFQPNAIYTNKLFLSLILFLPLLSFSTEWKLKSLQSFRIWKTREEEFLEMSLAFYAAAAAAAAISWIGAWADSSCKQFNF